MKEKKYIIYLLLLCIAFSGNDDLYGNKSDSIQVAALFSMAREAKDEPNNDFLRLLKKTLKLSSDNGYKAGEIEACRQIGDYYIGLPNYDSAYHYLITLDSLNRTIDNDTLLLKNIIHLSKPCLARGNSYETIILGFRAVELAEDLGNTTGLQKAYEILGLAFYQLKYFPLSINYLREAEYLGELNIDKSELAVINVLLSMVYEDLNNIDSSQICAENARKLFVQANSASALILAELMQAEILRYQKKYPSALKKYRDIGSSLQKESDYFWIDKFKLGLAKTCLSQIQNGVSLNRIKNSLRPFGYNSFENFLTLTISEKAKQANIAGMLQFLSVQREYYHHAGQYEKLIILNGYYIHITDSLALVNNALEIAQIMSDFDANQSNRKLELLEATSLANEAHMKLQKQQQLIIIIVAALLVLLGFGLRNRIVTIRRTKMQLIEINDQLELEKTRAERGEKFKEQFLTNVSHEIRTPMNAIMGMTNLMIKNKHYKEQEKYLEVLSISARHLLKLINDILDLSKLESGKMNIEKSYFSIQSVCKEIEEKFAPISKQKGLSFDVIIDQNIPSELKGDRRILFRIFDQLSSNAIANTHKGGITILCKQTGTTRNMVIIGITVKDSGSGIDKSLHDKVFSQVLGEAQFDKQSLDSSGLELVIIKQMIELQGGNIMFDSEPGKGTTFYFEIPYEISEKENIDEVEKQVSEKEISEHVKGLKILLVEDNDFNIMVATEELQDSIQEVLIDIARNGREALEKVSNNQYDVVLMDIQMPVMNGYDAAKAIREIDGEISKIPIIAMTANIMKSEVEKCFKAGMNSYISKPFETENLLKELYNNVLPKK